MVPFAFLGHNATIPTPGNGCSWVLVSAWARAGSSLPLSASKALIRASRCSLCKALTPRMGRKAISAPCINSHLAVAVGVGVDSSVVSAGVVALPLLLLHSEPVLCPSALSLQSTQRTSGMGRTRSSGRVSRNGSWICWRISEELGDTSVSAHKDLAPVLPPSAPPPASVAR